MQEAPDFVLFLGRFHPLVVHLPIGFLLFAFLLEILAKFQKNKALTAAIPLALLSGAISALVACILGYLLSLSGDYEANMLDRHFWVGIGTTVMAFLAWAIRMDKIKIPALQKLKPNMALLTLLVILIGVTGHYGGNLTHGSDYLVKYAPFNSSTKKELPQLASLEEAQIYPYLVEPILAQKCMSCHNASKQKGGLAMHTPTLLAKGGKNGPIFSAGSSAESELIRRVHLPETHEEFMPPEGKTALTEEEISLLTYWIDHADADFETTIANVETSEEIKQIAANTMALDFEGGKAMATTKLPEAATVSPELLHELSVAGFRIRELVIGSSLFDVSLPPNTISSNETAKQILEQLVLIKANIIRLDLSENNITNDDLAIVSQFSNLQKLQLEKNPIGDQGIVQLMPLKQLESINLYGTNIGRASLPHLSQLSSLKTVYAWQTNLKPADIPFGDKNLTEVKIVLGAL